MLSIIYNYFNEFKKAPGDHFYDLFMEQKEELDPNFYDRCMTIVGNIKEITNTNTNFLLNRIHKAVKHIKLEEAIITSARLIKAKKYDEASSTFIKALRDPDKIKNEYMDYLNDTSYRERRLIGKRYKMSTGVTELDGIIGGLNPWYITILGATKGKKTWHLIYFTVSALIQGLKVLYITKEMTKEECEDRFDQTAGFLSSEADKEIDTMEYKRGEWVKVKQKSEKTIYNVNAVKTVRSAIKSSGGKLYIADMCGAKLSHLEVGNVMDEIQEKENLMFDMVVVDYIGIMDAPGNERSKKDKIAANSLGFKNLQRERGIILMTAHQGNRTAMQSKTFESHQAADAIEPIFDSDLVLALCQTPKEEKNNIYRIYIAEFRHGPRHDVITQVQDLSTGQVCLGEATQNLFVNIENGEEEKTGGKASEY